MSLQWPWRVRKSGDERDKSAASSGPFSRLSPEASSLNTFTLRLLQALPPRNVQAASPFNIAYALTLLAHGARGDTREELLTALGLEDDPAALAAFALMLRDATGCAAFDDVDSAAALWLDRGLHVKQTFVDDVRGALDVGVTSVDLSDRASVVRAVNEWTHERTRGRISQLIEAADVPSPPALLITTAFHFAGKWVDRFSPDATVIAPFRAPGGDVPVHLMNQTLTTWYGDLPDMQVVDLSYSGGCGMLVLLPKPGIPLLKTIARIAAADAVSDIVDRLEFQKLRLFLPRLQLDTGAVSMTDALRHIGLCSIFGPMLTSPV